ncbi:CTLH/CRA C-terminal to LisH motif domain protein [Kalmanozyma brasiliensis GHG001]|uniref:Macrophage erythroblast attacher n=1 Tax=Kalmanozyma brasiliensis (strain GHG001) TaxID=1365824 RepID=V5F1P3_KALBG|nr:CTLH/CRA C-terminal to LisH motif domain protein [Kalmanozyma brasiliensis GHG001]EST09234.1 CTLH/CRA C-terminal to LisH motif domain protein [Kalmanozyma brasiliensis GHG001]
MEAMAIDNAGDTSVSPLPSSSNAPNLDGILLLEAPFAKVPFDELRRQQKTQQRLIERELVFASTTFNDLSRTSSSSSSAADVEKSLDAVLGRLKGLKRKLAPLSDAAKSSLKMAQSRTDHLSQLHSITDADSPDFVEWSKTRLDRMIVDYMLRRGYRESAKEMAQTRGIGDLVDVALFDEVARIEDSLCPPGWEGSEGEGVKPSCGLALAWCSENKATLRKIRTPLEFNLRLQEFVELTRTRSMESMKDAIAYARRHLLPLVTTPTPTTAATKPTSTAGTAPTQAEKEAEYDRLAASAMRREVSRALGLLACGPTSWAYADLYSLHRWSQLRDSFRTCALSIHSLPPQPILHIALSAGLSSLKLPQCYHSDGANTDCPICDGEGLGVLAKEVPWSHHQNSTLVCSRSGKLMDGDDPPLALGNGRVYAQSTVLELVEEGEGERGVRCPRTGEMCRVEDVRKVFIS